MMARLFRATVPPVRHSWILKFARSLGLGTGTVQRIVKELG
jgi:hypothetical protein